MAKNTHLAKGTKVRTKKGAKGTVVKVHSGDRYDVRWDRSGKTGVKVKGGALRRSKGNRSPVRTKSNRVIRHVTSPKITSSLFSNPKKGKTWGVYAVVKDGMKRIVGGVSDPSSAKKTALPYAKLYQKKGIKIRVEKE